jgi:hypothetical protein
MSVFWVGVVTAVAAVAGAGLSAYSASEAASARKDQLKYQEAVARNNQKIAEWQRSLTLQDAETAASQKLQEKAQLQGRQRAALAANGVAIGEGSALDLLATTEFNAQSDIADIQSSAARRAWGYENEGKGLQGQADFNSSVASSISPAKEGAIAGAGSLLSSAGSLASAYGSYKGAK